MDSTNASLSRALWRQGVHDSVLGTVTYGQAPLETVKVSLKSWLQIRFL